MCSIILCYILYILFTDVLSVPVRMVRGRRQGFVLVTASSEPRTVPGIWEALRDYAVPGWANKREVERKKLLAPLMLP